MAADSLKHLISTFRLPGFRRRFIIPEIVQSSAMDCGPACLKCLLDGFGTSVSYGRLREACQTDLDGTSIDTIEEVAIQLGLEAEQVMLPLDHLLLPEAKAFPAIITTSHPSGVTHFVVIWRRCGHFVQVMDPGTGRRWLSRQQLFKELYLHTMPVPAAAWLAWTGSEEFITTLFRRLANLGISRHRAVQRVKEVFQDMKLGWRPMATLDAAVRMIDSIVRSGGLHRGREAFRVIEAFYEKGSRATLEETPPIPPAYWSVSPAPLSPDGVEQLFLRGAVLVRALGRRPAACLVPDHISEDEGKPAPLSPELVAALNEPPTHPGRELFNLLRSDGLLSPLFLIVALALSAGGVVIEALLFRGLFDLSQELGLAGQRFEIMGAILVFATAILLLDLPIAAGILRLGRHLETRLRVAFLEKLPRLHDRYFQSRLTSDMAERCHSVHSLRALPGLGGQFIRASFELVLTTAAIAWIYPSSAPIAVITAIISVCLPLMANSYLSERNLRVRNHTGALSRV
ncbi:MAG: cysteine peptidase family C39 domain-containing protein [bacterium]